MASLKVGNMTASNILLKML